MRPCRRFAVLFLFSAVFAIAQQSAPPSIRPAASGSDRSQRIFLRADKAVAYGDLMATMDTLRAAGYLKISLVALESAPSPASSP